MVDGQQVEGTFRSHQVPLPAARTDGQHRAVLEQWLRSYRPEELFDESCTGRGPVGAQPPGSTADERQPGQQRGPAAE